MHLRPTLKDQICSFLVGALSGPYYEQFILSTETGNDWHIPSVSECMT